MPKSFQVALNRAANTAQEQPEAPKPLPFTFADDPDTELQIYLPDESQVAILLSVTDGMTTGSTQVSTFINLFMDLLDEEYQPYVRRRLLSRADKLGVMDLLPVIQWLVEEGVGRPTEPSPDSPPSPASTGPRSTGRARRKVSTPSSSPSTDSSTSSTPGVLNGSKIEKSSTD